MSVASQREPAARRLEKLPMNEITPCASQPRRSFNDHSMMELAASIRRFGLMQPITVRPLAGGYEIVMGERRFRACQLLGLDRIDAFVLPVSSRESAYMALIENVQREALSFFEEAEAYQRLTEDGSTQEALSQRLGKSPSFVANKLRLLRLTPEERAFVTDNALSERHVRAVLRLCDPAARLRVLRLSALRALSVRQTEALVEREIEKLPVPRARRITSLVRDHRPYLNALSEIVRQMTQAGVPADMTVEDCEGEVKVAIRLPKAINK